MPTPGVTQDAGGHGWRRCTAALGLVVVLGLAACSGGDEPSPDRSPAPSTDYAGTRTCDEQDRDACYDLSVIDQAYCIVQQVRAMYTDGRLDTADLPTWADRSDTAQGPRLIDFRGDPGIPYDRVSDDLDDLVTSAGRQLDDRQLQRCQDGLDQATVVRTEGRRAGS